MSFKPKTSKHQPKSQATPLATDLLEMIRGQLAEGSFGTGFGPLQQEAGTAARQFVSSGGGEQFDFSPLVGQLSDIFQRETDRGAAQVREGMGGLGLRFSTPLAREEGRFRQGAQQDFLANLGQLFQQSFENRQNRFLSGIGLLGGLGQQATAPAFGLGSQGILPQEITQSQSPWVSGLNALSSVGGALLGGPFGAAMGSQLFGGGGGQTPAQPAPINRPGQI